MKGRKRARASLLLLCMLLCFGNSAMVARNGWAKQGGKTYYYTKGKKAVGLKKIKGKYYFFDKKGVLYKKGWKTVKGKKYYFSKKNGAASTGAVKIGKKRYLFTKEGKLCATGVQKYGKKYYYTKKGIIQTGLKTVKGRTYFFTAKGPAKTGWHTYKGKKYYFGAEGAAVTGRKKIAGKTYAFSSKGVLQKELDSIPEIPDVPEPQLPSVLPQPEPEEETEPGTEPETEVKFPEGIKTIDSPYGGKRAIYYYEKESHEILERLNEFRISEGKEPFMQGTDYTLKLAQLRAVYNCAHYGEESIDEWNATSLGGTNPTKEGTQWLAVHGPTNQQGIGGGVVYDGMAEDTVTDWLQSEPHRRGFLGDYKYAAPAVVEVVDTNGLRIVSCIVTLEDIDKPLVDSSELDKYGLSEYSYYSIRVPQEQSEWLFDIMNIVK